LGDWGEISGGGRPMHPFRPPNILRITVIGCEEK